MQRGALSSFMPIRAYLCLFVPICAYSCLFVPNRLPRHRNECGVLTFFLASFLKSRLSLPVPSNGNTTSVTNLVHSSHFKMCSSISTTTDLCPNSIPSPPFLCSLFCSVTQRTWSAVAGLLEPVS